MADDLVQVRIQRGGDRLSGPPPLEIPSHMGFYRETGNKQLDPLEKLDPLLNLEKWLLSSKL